MTRRRSALYMPASNPRAIAKARDLASEIVILDLEDAVAPDAKPTAREAAVAAVREGGFGARALVVRVNGLDTAWGEADCAALAACPPDAVLLPKIGRADDVSAYAGRLGEAVPLWAMIETPLALLRLDEIAGAPRMAGLVVGPNDLAKELRATPGRDRQELAGALTLIVAAARAHGLAALDGVFNDIDDADGFEAECLQGRRFGFDGKTLIHPRQIEACNRAFGPSPAEIAWAERVVAAFDDPASAGAGAIKVEGRMVERLHLAQARQLIAEAD